MMCEKVVPCRARGTRAYTEAWGGAPSKVKGQSLVKGAKLTAF